MVHNDNDSSQSRIWSDFWHFLLQWFCFCFRQWDNVATAALHLNIRGLKPDRCPYWDSESCLCSCYCFCWGLVDRSSNSCEQLRISGGAGKHPEWGRQFSVDTVQTFQVPSIMSDASITADDARVVLQSCKSADPGGRIQFYNSWAEKVF